jgi:hypothetical protein
MLLSRLLSKPPERRYGEAYWSEVHRILGIWRWNHGEPVDPREVALLHRRALEQATRAIDPRKRLALTPSGLAELEHHQMTHLTRLLQYVGLSVADYNANERQQAAREEWLWTRQRTNQRRQ